MTAIDWVVWQDGFKVGMGVGFTLVAFWLYLMYLWSRSNNEKESKERGKRR